MIEVHPTDTHSTTSKSWLPRVVLINAMILFWMTSQLNTTGHADMLDALSKGIDCCCLRRLHRYPLCTYR